MTAKDERDDPLKARLHALASRLGYALASERAAGASTYYTSWDDYDRPAYRHVVRQAFEVIGVEGVFGFARAGAATEGFTPLVYLAVAASAERADAIHRQVWSQGVVPILLLATPEGLQIRASLGPSPKRPATVDWAVTAAPGPLVASLHRLTRISLAGSLVWSDFAVERRHRVDSSLLQAIETLSRSVLIRYPELVDEAHLVNAVIGRFLYFYILLDRGVVSAAWISRLEACATIANDLREGTTGETVWPADEAWALFDAIDAAMNGSIFLVTPEDRAKLGPDLLHLVRRAIRHGDDIGPQDWQPGFFEVSFRTLRTETLSAIYELFLHLDDPTQKEEDGAFYTPPFLVDYVLDEADRQKPLTSASRVLDPTAGSGAFLVGAYRRILERSLQAGGLAALPHLRGILLNCVFGIEKNGQAASVARFSLYLTMLDYLDGVDIDQFYAAVCPDKVFPDLTANLVVADAFDDAARPGGPEACFTHVVGNPPWTSYGEQRSRLSGVQRINPKRDAELKLARDYAANLLREKGRYPVSTYRLSELFVWKVSRDLLDKDGITALLLPARSFVSRSASAFPAAVLRELKLLGVANLSHFRYKLFENARTPAVALFARQGTSAPLDLAWIYSPQLSSQAIAKHGFLWSIIVSPSDVSMVRIRDLARTEDAWFHHLILRPLDRRYVRRFELWSASERRTLGDFFRRNGLKMGRGGTPLETGVAARDIIGKQAAAGLMRAEPLLHGQDWPLPDLSNAKGVYRAFFGGRIILVPRSAETAVFVERPVAFNSSFTGIARVDGEAVDVEGMRGLAVFLRSALADYLGALHGRTWIMDRLRLESRDLERIPFPFDSLGDPALQALARDSSGLVEHFSKALGLGPEFADVVAEYANFRFGYEDAQTPDDAYAPPTEPMVRAYGEALAKELSDAFGPNYAFCADTVPAADGDSFLTTWLTLGGTQERRETAHAPTSFVPTSFTPTADISADDDGFVLSKPNMRSAWTLEQAYSDAGAVLQLVAGA